MSEDRVQELRREERVILAWIRDVTAEKQARLMQIRAELRELSAKESPKAVSLESSVGD